MTTRVLFVCLGNICRSPTAEGVLRGMLDPSDAVEVDSAGTGNWHVGNPPDPRAVAEAARRGLDISGLRARQVRPEDFDRFDLILTMDRSNLAALRRLRPPDSRADLKLLLEYGPVSESHGGDIPDPYYEGGFDGVYDLIEGAARSLLDTLRR